MGGIGLQIPKVQKVSAIGLIALLIAVFPANIFMALEPEAVQGWDLPTWVLYLRLAFQPLFVYLVWLAGLKSASATTSDGSR